MGLGEMWSGDASHGGGSAAAEVVGGTDEEREEYIRLMMDCAREYVRAPTSADLRKLYVGLVPPTDVANGEAGSASTATGSQYRRDIAMSNHSSDDQRHDGKDDEEEDAHDPEPLPVRTVVVRIRTDVLCGAVMDALSHAVENVGGEMTKRQGGHLRAVLPGYWLSPCAWSSAGGGGADDSTMDSVSSGLTSLLTFSPEGHVGKRGVSRRAKARMRMMPPTMIDAQLCARKRSRECERVLLLRTYRVGGSGTDGVSWEGRGEGPVTSNTFADCDNVVEEDEDDGMSGTLIREAASLVQRMELEGEHSFPVLPARSGALADPNAGQGGFSSLGNILTSPLRLISGYGGDNAPRKLSSAHLGPTSSGGSIFPSTQSVTEAVSVHLQQHFHSTDSVEAPFRNRKGTIPSLSSGDWPFVQSAWRFLKECLNELDNRDLAFSTLSTCPFGAFPALPTLDVQYCSQIRRLCRENMILSLLKSAAELEQFARESEYQCANLIQLLRPTFELYLLAPPALPTPIPLTAYPLDFQAPEAACPPWGQRVMEAMNRVAAISSMDNAQSITSSHENGEGSTTADQSQSVLSKRLNKFKLAKDAVSLVVQSFQRQADEEQSARMGRKNIQVMDRLAKMQAHKRSSIITIRDSYGCNPTVTKGADDFHSRANKAISNAEGDSNGTFFAESDQVPLLTCGILVGGSTGTCYISAHQILFATKVIPLVGFSRCWLYSIQDIELSIAETSGSVLNPLPPAMIVHKTNAEGDILDGEDAFSFVPSIAARRLKSFIDVLKAVSTEDPETLKFSARGGLLYMFEEKKSIARSAMGIAEMR